MAIGDTGSPYSGSSQTLGTPNSATQILAMAPEAQRKLWAKVVEYGQRQKFSWQKHTGGRMDAILWSGQQLSAGNGHTITFTTASPYFKDVSRNEELLLAPEQYNREHLNTYTLRVSQTRLGHEIGDLVEDEMGMVNEIVDKRAENIGIRSGEKLTEDIDMMFLLKTPAENIMFARNVASFDELTPASTLNYDDVILMEYFLQSRGKAPKMGKDKMGNDIHKFLIHSPHPGLHTLKRDLVDKGILTSAGVRGDENTIFSGGMVELDGQVIEKRDIVMEARGDALACPLAPIAILGRTLTDGVVSAPHGGPAVVDATEVWGGVHHEWTTEQYTRPMRQFAGWNYDWGWTLTAHSYASATANTPGKAPLYAILYNTAGTDRGKWSIVEYDAIETTHGRYLNVTKYLRSANGGAQSRGYTQVGSVIFDSTKNTTTHTMGQTHVIPCTSKGVPYCYHLGLAAGAGMFAWGRWKTKREVERHNAQLTRTFHSGIYGQALRYDAASYVCGSVVMVSAVEYPNMKIVPTLAS